MMTKTSTVKRSVLIVDDDEWFAQSVQRALLEKGVKVDVATHGLMGMDKLDNNHYDLLILDLFLPGPNGLALLHELQSHPDLSQIPVILWSSATDKSLSDQLKPYGVVEIMDKTTVTPKDILDSVLHKLEWGRK